MILKVNSFSNTQLFSSPSPWSRCILRIWTCSAWNVYVSVDFSKYWSYAQLWSEDKIEHRCSKNWSKYI